MNIIGSHGSKTIEYSFLHDIFNNKSVTTVSKFACLRTTHTLLEEFYEHLLIFYL